MNFRLLRHATSLLKIHNKTILIDPMLSPKGTMEPVKEVPNQNPNPLVDLPVTSEDLISSCDCVLITHTHRDHFDQEAERLIPKGIKIFCQPEDKPKLVNMGFSNVVEVSRHITWEGISITRTSARHGHGVTAKMMAPVSGYVICGPEENVLSETSGLEERAGLIQPSGLLQPTVYITGDSVFYSGIRKVLDRYRPDIVICYAGEAAFSSGRPITMGIEDITNLHRCSPSAKIIAVHMESWNHCTLTRKALSEFAAREGMSKNILIPSDGEELKF